VTLGILVECADDLCVALELGMLRDGVGLHKCDGPLTHTHGGHLEAVRDQGHDDDTVLVLNLVDSCGVLAGELGSVGVRGRRRGRGQVLGAGWSL
jgi:hypothetical protein